MTNLSATKVAEEVGDHAGGGSFILQVVCVVLAAWTAGLVWLWFDQYPMIMTVEDALRPLGMIRHPGISLFQFAVFAGFVSTWFFGALPLLLAGLLARPRITVVVVEAVIQP